MTAATVLQTWPELRLDCVELDDNQAETAALFGTAWLLEDPRFSLSLEDGRQHLQRQEGRYDVIIVDTWGQAINQEFYNADFFAEASRALTEGGLLYVKLPADELSDPEEMDVMLRSAAAGLPHAYVLPPSGAGVFPGLIGSRQPLALPPVSARGDLPPRMRDLYAAARRGLRAIDAGVLDRLPGGRINSDDQPWFFTVGAGDPARIDAHLAAVLADAEPVAR